MKHEDAVLLLDGLVVGDLEAGVADALRNHLASCEECRDLADTLEALSSARPPVDAAVHPESREVVAFAGGGADLEVHALARIAAHLKNCEACRGEVDTVRRADAAARRSVLAPAARFFPGAAGASGSWRAAVLAAMVIALILVYPAYLGLRRYPESVRAARTGEAREREVREENRRLREQIANLGTDSTLAYGPVVLNFLEPPMRSPSAAVPTLTAEGRSIPIAVDLDPGAIRPGPERYRFEIVTGSEVRWSCELTASQVRGYIDSPQGAVILSVPTDGLAPGAYELRVVRVGGTGGPIFAAPFRIAR